MALDYKGLVVAVDVPIGYVTVAISDFSNWQYEFKTILTFDADPLEDPNPVIQFTSIFAEINSQINSKLADFDVVNNVEAFAIFNGLTRNAQALFFNETDQYTADIRIYVKTNL